MKSLLSCFGSRPVLSLLKELSMMGGSLNCSSVLKASAMLFWACPMHVELKGKHGPFAGSEHRIRKVHSL